MVGFGLSKQIGSRSMALVYIMTCIVSALEKVFSDLFINFKDEPNYIVKELWRSFTLIFSVRFPHHSSCGWP